MAHNRRVMMALMGGLVAAPTAGTAAGTTTAGRNGGEPEQYQLPPLPYPANALEPHISKEIITLHHDKHHKAYVDGLNKALAALAGGGLDPAQLQAQLRAVAFNGSGHLLHALYFAGMGKDGGEPEGSLSDQVERDFGGAQAMLTQLKAAVSTAPGSGWGIIAWEPLGKRLVALQLAKHEDQMFIGAIPILALDAWEHAYYLQYQNRKPDYLEAALKVINWKEIGRRFEAARSAASPGVAAR